MNACLAAADRETHVKIVIGAMAASILVALIAMSAHVGGGNEPSVGPRIERPVLLPIVPRATPVRASKVVIV